MTISVKLTGMQQVVAGTSVVEMPVTGYSTVRDVLDYVNKKYPKLAISTNSMFIVIDHQIVTLDRALRADDTIEFIPAIGGG